MPTDIVTSYLNSRAVFLCMEQNRLPPRSIYIHENDIIRGHTNNHNTFSITWWSFSSNEKATGTLMNIVVFYLPNRCLNLFDPS